MPEIGFSDQLDKDLPPAEGDVLQQPQGKVEQFLVILFLFLVMEFGHCDIYPGWVHNIEGDIRAAAWIQLEELDERGRQVAWTPLVSSPRH